MITEAIIFKNQVQFWIKQILS